MTKTDEGGFPKLGWSPKSADGSSKGLFIGKERAHGTCSLKYSSTVDGRIGKRWIESTLKLSEHRNSQNSWAQNERRFIMWHRSGKSMGYSQRRC